MLFFVLLVCFFIPHTAFAHAVLEKSTPVPDQQLDSPPTEVELIFNERLEDKLYFIKVFNENGDIVSDSDTEMSADQKQISLALPSLSNGHYAVSYRVLSADGHPVNGSYIFSVGDDLGANESLNQLLLEKDGNGTVLGGVLHSIVRVLYYLALILTTGWIIWGTLTNLEQGERRSIFRQWALYLQMALMLTTLGMGLFQFAELLDHWTLGDFLSVLTGTTAGQSLGLSILLSLLGFAILLRFKWLDQLWVLFILAVTSVNGHASAFEPVIRTISFDLIHLIAAAIWGGGLFYILIYWKREKEHAKQFISVFSKLAMISMLVLIVTGVILTLIFLPDIQYLFNTKWGIMLLIKTALVLLVIVTAGFLRNAIKKQQDHSIGRLLKLDIGLMVLILGIVGVFTHLNPLPQNEPFEWHEQDPPIEFTASILPKVPGDNHFMVEASSLEDGVEIKRVELFLNYKDNEEVAPIKVPFSEIKQSKRVQTMIDGKYLPFSGNWTAELRILDSDDNETVYRTDFIVF